jgi:hypothetical protein
MKKYLVSICVMFLMLGTISVASAATVFLDDFNSENEGIAEYSTLNYDNFNNWEVTGGTVDLIGNGYFDFIPYNGLYVDLDGSTNSPGLMSLKSGLALNPGNYILSFDLAGSHTSSPTDTVTVTASINGFSKDYTLVYDAPFSTYTYAFLLKSPDALNLSFQNNGNDNMGALLDNVKVSSVPIPGSLLLLGSGVVGLVMLRGRRKASQF